MPIRGQRSAPIDTVAPFEDFQAIKICDMGELPFVLN